MTITADLDRAAAGGGALTTLSNGRHQWQSDLSAEAGGQATAPQPHDLLDSALAACTALTLELVIRRKGWPVTALHVEVDRHETKGADGVVDYRLDRRITLSGELNTAQREQLLGVANRCPVHRILEGRIQVQTTLA